MDFLVKIERFQIKPNVINLKSTLVATAFKTVQILKAIEILVPSYTSMY